MSLALLNVAANPLSSRFCECRQPSGKLHNSAVKSCFIHWPLSIMQLFLQFLKMIILMLNVVGRLGVVERGMRWSELHAGAKSVRSIALNTASLLKRIIKLEKKKKTHNLLSNPLLLIHSEKMCENNLGVPFGFLLTGGHISDSFLCFLLSSTSLILVHLCNLVRRCWRNSEH